MVACIPVEEGKELMPGFPASATYSTYEEVSCPDCGRKMWLGERGKAEVEAGRAIMQCMRCVVLSAHPADLANMQRLHGA